jgi:hypothetical protein
MDGRRGGAMLDEVKRRLATRCLLCTAPLKDSVSVEVGIGPKCRKRAGLDDKTFVGRAEANAATAQAAMFAEEGNVRGVLEIAAALEALFPTLSRKVRERFIGIRVTRQPDAFLVQTPYNDQFVTRCWETRLGRWDRELKGRLVALDRKGDLWAVLRECFPGQQGLGPDGELFEIPPIAHGVPIAQQEPAHADRDAHTR